MEKDVLNGLLVVDMSEVYQGPLAAQILGDFGADVIKVERAGKGEVLRTSDPVSARKGIMSSHFAAANRNKRSIAIDAKSAEDMEMLIGLLARADVLVHNFRPGVAERLGIGYEALHKLNPRLIYAWASGFGETGPLHKAGGQDLIIQSLSGMARESAGADGQPHFVNPPAIDYASGQTLVQGILLALLSREKTGKGQRVAINLLDTAVAIQSLEAATTLMHGATTKWFDLAPNFVFETQDGYLTVLGFFRENPLRLLCQALEVPDASTAPHLATPDDQRVHRQEIQALLGDAFRALSTADAYARVAGRDLLCAPAQSLAEALAHPQIAANGLLIDTQLPGGEAVRLVGNPLKLSDTPARIRRGPPALDADRADILDLIENTSSRDA
ncbi:CaiB/BaiF CoA transferase family protein [Hoeflea alexandrii]|uniref:CaiB/BaiF CoA transferase family protein n=1 Tax=Hoeflea alexandrii TaxID=288436 RepID=UPI0022AE7A4F|nr:CoA transferase [Hoeflea alexandrii]MCZ4291673.1 CoA transferase [Hoeflea alexandrii]